MVLVYSRKTLKQNKSFFCPVNLSSVIQKQLVLDRQNCPLLLGPGLLTLVATCEPNSHDDVGGFE